MHTKYLNIMLALVVCIFAGCDVEPNKGVSQDLSVSGTRFKEGEYGSRSVVGSVKNSGKKTYGYAQVQINLYDGSGTQVGSTMANINNLEPGKSWDFEAPILEEKAETFKVMDITGF